MPVYLDHAASTPLAQEALEAMTPYFSDRFGNPSSVHSFGQGAEAAVEDSRAEIASLLGCHADEIIFTSGGSESDNLAVKGASLAMRMSDNRRHRVLISPVEHPAVLHAAAQLERQFGMEVETLPVDSFGRVAPADLTSMLEDDVALVSVIHANNEIGTVNQIQELGAICRQRGALFHTDSVQGVAHFDLDLAELPLDLLSLGAHKFYGPKGVGALYFRRGTPLLNLQAGGSQEFGLRAGTHNVPLIVGMARAYQHCVATRPETTALDVALRDRIIERVLAEIPDAKLTGHPVDRLPNHASFAFRGVDGNDLLAALDLEGYACSSGSACKTGEPEPSSVMTALSLPADWGLGSLRVTVGRTNTSEEIDGFLTLLPDVIHRLRVRAPA